MKNLDYAREMRREQAKQVILKIFVYAMLVFWALVVLFPFYWMILTSLKSTGAYNAETVPQLITLSPTIENYIRSFTEANIGKYFINTIIFTVATTAIMLIITVPAAFAFARLNFKGKNLVFLGFLALMMIPNELVVITNFTTITNLDLRNNFIGLILPSVASVFYIYLLKENFEQVPDELYLAAKVDGTTDLKYLLKVIECWNSYVWPRLVTDDEAYYLVSNGIQQIRESGFGREDIPAMMAAVVIVSLPLIVLFVAFRDKIMAGVARGGLKG